MTRIKNLQAEFRLAKNLQNEYVKSITYGKTPVSLENFGKLALKTREAQNKLKYAAAKKIQNAFRNSKKRYILVFNKSNINKYPKYVKKMFSNTKTKFLVYPNNPTKQVYLSKNGGSLTYILKNNKTGYKTLLEIYKFLKDRLPERMLPKFKRIIPTQIIEKTKNISKKANIIKRSILPVRKVIHILEKHPNLRYAAKIMTKLTNMARQYSNYIQQQNFSIEQTKMLISRNIGPCHINTMLRNNPTVNKVTYLLYYNNQMKIACEKIVKMPEKEFISKFKEALSDRPCIENLIDSLTQVAFGEAMWKGSNKALNLTKNQNKNYLRNIVIAKYMKTHLNSIRKGGNMSNYTKNRLWNSIKNRPVYVWTRNGPIFMNFKSIRNSRKISNNSYNLYAKNLE